MTRDTFAIPAALLLFVVAQTLPAAAQEPESADAEEVVVAAARYVIEHDVKGAAGLEDRLVVDTESGFEMSPQSRPMTERGQRAAAHLATVIGGTPGRLEDIMSCPGRAPTPEEFKGGYWGCRLSGNVSHVLQVDDPEIHGDTASVWIALWAEVRDSAGVPRHVATRAAEVALTRGGEGGWRVEGIGARISGRF